MAPAATCHLAERYAIELCFLLRVEDSIDELLTTLRLSHKTVIGSSTGTPNIQNLKHNAVMCSIHTHNAINSLENVLDSTVF